MATKALSSPVGMQGFSRRRLSELRGIGLFLLAAYIALALATYTTSDPSPNHTADGPVQNMAGLPGAYFADISLQVFGLSSIFLILALAAWGWRLFSKSYTRGWWLRVCALMGLMVVSAIMFSALPSPGSWAFQGGLGGAIGGLLKLQFAKIFPVWMVFLFAFAGTVALVPFAFSLRFSEWMAMAILCRVTVGGSARTAARFGQVLWRRGDRYYDDEDEMDEDERIQAEDWDDEEKPKKRRFGRNKSEPVIPVVAKPVKKIIEAPKVAKKKEEAPQTALELKQRKGEYELPETSQLNKVPAKSRKAQLSESALNQNARLLESTLQDFGVKGEITRVCPGPVVTMYELEPSPGTKSSRVIGLADDIARSMSAISARIAVVPGRNVIGIELPNAQRETVYLREVFEEEDYQSSEAKLPLAMGKDIGGESITVDLAKMPHLLVAGTTGSGKSVAINTMILSLLFKLTPEQCRFILIDPKMLELSVYDDIPHLLAPVVTEPGKAVVALKWAVKEMENRYRLMSNLGVRNIDNYNKRIEEAKRKNEDLYRTVQTGFDHETGKPIMEKQKLEMSALPYIVVVVDEMADLMLVAGKDIEGSIQRLAQMARAAGIHLIMATQRPSVDVITGVIKANFPTRVSFQVTSKIDSRTILGEQGAEQLLGQGDMLYMAGGGRITRIHGPFVSDKEVETIVTFLKSQGAPIYDDNVTRDDEAQGEFGLGSDEEESEEDKALYDQAVQIVLREQKASTSYVQRRLKIGYNRAARIIEKMEQDGIVGAANHVGKREVLARSGE